MAQEYPSNTISDVLPQNWTETVLHKRQGLSNETREQYFKDRKDRYLNEPQWIPGYYELLRVSEKAQIDLKILDYLKQNNMSIEEYFTEK